MSKSGPRRMYDIAAVRSEVAEKRGGAEIDFRMGDKEFSIPAPGFIPDEIKVKATDDLAFAQALLGDSWDEFAKCGGRSDDITLLFQLYTEAQGASLGESKG